MTPSNLPKLTQHELERKALEVRSDIVKMISEAGSGHPGGALGLVELYITLYFSVMHHDPENPLWEDRDRLFTSNGHTAPVRYVTLSHAGYFPMAKLKTFRKFGSSLQGHPERVRLPEMESTSGPLGSGLGQALGCALGARMDGKRFRVYCISSDGEHDEGNHWEAVLFGAAHKISNLTLFVDRNHIQIDGRTEEVLPLESLSEKYKAFNWNVIVAQGHDFNQIIDAISRARSEYQKPTVIILNTTPGKGVKFMENRFEWHGKAPNEDEKKLALKEFARQLKAHDRH